MSRPAINNYMDGTQFPNEKCSALKERDNALLFNPATS